jgi:hypothetical protein
MRWRADSANFHQLRRVATVVTERAKEARSRQRESIQE